ncbi:winged helix-turn-helix domain-containing protein [Rheinheimera sp.]|uniref:winged helix-turn-helix domain-containing protein n=1 Tax=Rheinheimera sp. TaxID=1869214 RepID=UPI002734B45F|nr:winged helix-turn-helix domain-containing protein [Rheinheimera sp.]MDP2713609.1 winged helix-turn-helix domain-containing protein [Rheinheimera sp.]
MNGKTLTLEPKVMDVLHTLASRQGDVISQQDIFTKVWGSVTYSSSMIQRAIALLRKAFGDDATAAKYIKTYPKRGYALIATVKTEHKQAPEKGIQTPLSGRKLYAVILMLCLIIPTVYWLSPALVKTKFSRLYPVTTNMHNEYEAQYDPSGNYLLFLRDLPNQKGNQVWVRQLSNATEFRLTNDTEITYAGITWSPNGQSIAYVKKGPEADQIGYLSFDPITVKALASNHITTRPFQTVLGHRFQWSKLNQLYFIEIPSMDRSKIVRLDLATGSTSTLSEASGKDMIQNIALAPDNATLAYTKSVKQNRYEVRLLDLHSGSDSLLTTLENRVLGISWHPNGEHLLASNNHKLKLINRSGDVKEIQFNNFNPIIDATYSPDGKQILMQSVEMDVDILYSEPPFDQQRLLIDSKAVDILPSFSPDESQILFLSNRNGKQQLFIASLTGESRLIFRNPDEQELFGMAWSPDGKQVVTASKDSLYFINLNNGVVRTEIHKQSPFYIQRWYSHEPALLVSRFEKNNFIPAKYHYNSGKFEVLDSSISARQCLYMTLDETDKLMFTDGQQVVRLNTSNQPEVLWKSSGHQIKGFALDKGELVLIQNDHQNIDNVLISKASLVSGLESLWYQYDANNFKVVSGNRDHSKLLMHSAARKVRTIVRLE